MLEVDCSHSSMNLFRLTYLFLKAEESIVGMFGFITLSLTFGSELPP